MRGASLLHVQGSLGVPRGPLAPHVQFIPTSLKTRRQYVDPKKCFRANTTRCLSPLYVLPTCIKVKLSSRGFKLARGACWVGLLGNDTPIKTQGRFVLNQPETCIQA